MTKKVVEMPDYPSEKKKVNCCEVVRNFEDGRHYFLCNEGQDELGCCYNLGELGSCSDEHRIGYCENQGAQKDAMERMASFCKKELGEG